MNVVNGKHFSERDIVRIFKGTCEAVRALHDYHTVSGSQSQSRPTSSRATVPSTSPVHQQDDHHSDDEEGDEFLSHPQGNGDSSVNVPLVKRRQVDVEDGIFGDDEEVSRIPDLQNGNPESGKGEHVPYAHRDIKPGWVFQWFRLFLD